VNEAAQSRFRQGLSGILSVPESLLTPEFGLNEGNWDSVVVISAIALIDDTYGITVPAARLAGCRSFGEVLALVESRLPEKRDGMA
jgi:acyl carrier protein